MINNRLTTTELERIFTPILRLDSIEIIKENIYKVLHFTKSKPSDKEQYIINSTLTGISSTYRGFEIEIRRLNDFKHGYLGVIIQFRKRKKIMDYFINQKSKIVNDIKKLCGKEINDAWFKEFDPWGIVQKDGKEEFLYQLGTLNPDWKEQNKLSPLAIYTKADTNSDLIEFLFTPECYHRKSDKTVLKDNWLEIFSLYTPSW